jgi:ABC-type bacteriocin/lantibiotic exporter with double-glycine peptidase domain
MTGLYTPISAEIRQTAETISIAISQEGMNTQRQIINTMEALQTQSYHKDQVEQLLKSLYFETMNKRKNQTSKSHTETFNGIFNENVSHDMPWDSFSHWLRSNDDNIYWMSGKAGSGKSTLMRFLVAEYRTLEVLKLWTGDPLIVSTFI